MVDEDFATDVAGDEHWSEPQAEQHRGGGGGGGGPDDASGVLPWKAVPVVGVPHYPTCIKWSQENLLAVGAGHVITILDPASMSGPRGFVPVTASPVFDFGRVQPQDLRARSLFQLCLARDPRPEVRCVDWSPPGLAQNGGSLLAMCTTDSRVKLYCAPFCDFQSEWVEIRDLTELIFNHCQKNNFRDAELAAAKLSLEDETVPPPSKCGSMAKRKLSDNEEPQHRKVQKTRHSVTDTVVGGAELASEPPATGMSSTVDTHTLKYPLFLKSNDGGSLYKGASAAIEKDSRVEVLEDDDGLRYWVGGSVVEIMNGEALIKFDQPRYGATQEWVPFHGQSTSTENLGLAEETDVLYPTNSSIQKDDLPVLLFKRPRIRPAFALDALQKCLTDEAGGKRSLLSGELVEAWINDRWHEGRVVETHGSDVIIKSCSVNVVVHQDKLRLPPFWDDESRTWTVKSPVSNPMGGLACHDSTDDSQCATETSVGLPIDSSVTLHGDHADDQTQNQHCTTFAGKAVNSLLLDTDHGKMPSLGLSELANHPSHDLTADANENSYFRVYKRRGLVGLQSPAVSVPLRNSIDSEHVTTRSTRDRRRPTKLRDEETVPWLTSADGDAPHGNVLLDSVNKDAVKGGRGGKGKDVRFAEEVGKVKRGRSVKDADPLGSRSGKRVGEPHKENNENQRWISAPEFAARSELLSPVALAWSSKYEVQVLDDPGHAKKEKLVLLGAGMKSGRVSLWQMAFPSAYAIDGGHVPTTASFLGFLNAHESWVTTLSWASCSNFHLEKFEASIFSDEAEPAGDALLLATGCVDGSVKLWAGLTTDLSSAQIMNGSVPFMFLRQAARLDNAPVTALLLFIPPRCSTRALLAVGKGSGNVAVWELKSSGDFHLLCSQDLAHQQMVTGFSWTSDGRCLYSCGQDSLKYWDASHDQLLPLRFPDGSTVFPSVTAPDVCSLEALESFHGLTLSPSGLALAAVRGIASDLLDQMYQARSQKGMVQLFWLGNEHKDIKKVGNDHSSSSALPLQGMSEQEKACWELNIIQALEGLQDPRRTLVLWDVIGTLLSLKEKIGAEGVIAILSNWLVHSASAQEGAEGAVSSHESATEGFQNFIPKASCRQLQMLNVIYRRIFLSHVNSEILSGHLVEELGSVNGDLEAPVWRFRLRLIEHELRQRLVHMRLKSASVLRADNLGDCAQGDKSDEVQLFLEWVLGNMPSLGMQLVSVATQLQESTSDPFGNVATQVTETCNYCNSTVPFESPEIATCSGTASNHRLQRCSVSMRVCPPVCLWHCSCCGRSATKQAPTAFFTMLSGEDVVGMTFPVLNQCDAFPCCPFCGIMMCRLLPNFFLTPTLV